MESKLEVLVKSASELRNKQSQKLSPFVSIRLRGKKVELVQMSSGITSIKGHIFIQPAIEIYGLNLNCVILRAG